MTQTHNLPVRLERHLGAVQTHQSQPPASLSLPKHLQGSQD